MKAVIVNCTCYLLGICFIYCLTGCEKILDNTKQPYSRTSLYDEVWKVMDEQYALFEVKGVNWQNEYVKNKLKINEQLSDAELFSLLDKQLNVLQDGHVSLISSFDTATYNGFYNGYPANFNFNNVLKTYLGNSYRQAGPVIYTIKDSIGYLYYSSFAQDVSDAQLDTIINYLSSSKALIIDVRNNTGGRYANAEKLFSHFIKQRTLVKYERVKNGPAHNDFKQPEAFYINPAVTAYTKKICVLTNRKCFSACNDFVLFMKLLPTVQCVGDQTGGGGGIPYNYLLANGWLLQYTATQTLSINKQPVEQGILPDVKINITPVQESNGRDAIIEKAYSLLK
jgi:Peptidase family S41